ncbi:nuclear transport factor 2 family protein [Streptomyces sp. CT34]|uniref:nuclear transport factor 2 family protein n=1 Tax=Streptomyces sp. CT34 TaxID=1553907 RepID=UPI000B32577A|nr:nuclear transport factor 2 family protein [Streptomyces sp. CT34]
MSGDENATPEKPERSAAGDNAVPTYQPATTHQTTTRDQTETTDQAMTTTEVPSPVPAQHRARPQPRPEAEPRFPPQLQHLIDRAEITDLLNRYLRSLDEGIFDEAWARAFHTEEVTAVMPVGTVHGRDALLASVGQAMALFDRTVHLGTNAVIDIDGDRATARGAQLSTHVLADGSEDLFISAGHADNELVRPPDGWRISASSLRITWTQGTPPPIATGPETGKGDTA